MTSIQQRRKCIILLSNKSSGSSACQNLLAKQANISHVKKTTHGENETLYWSLAASILRLPQLDMVDSEVPIPHNKALVELQQLLKNNVDKPITYKTEKELIFKGWRALCEQYSPIFFEKSPHHLYQWSSLELITECIENFKEIDFLIIGLVRNPMDTIYSAFSRWKTSPEKNQYVWLQSYKNLLKLKEQIGEQLIIIKYEDMISVPDTLDPIHKFCGVTPASNQRSYFHQNSISKWKRDNLFGFNLSPEVKELAIGYGYKDVDLSNKSTKLWPIYRGISGYFYRTTVSIKHSIKSILVS